MSISKNIASLAPRASVVLAAAVLAACAVGPDYHPAASPVQAARFGAAEASDAYREDKPAAQFWTAFDDPLLQDLIQDSMLANHDLRIALARLNESRALLRELRLDSLPTVTAHTEYTRALQSEDQARSQGKTGSALDRDARESRLYTGGFDAYWELDFFGRARRAIEAGRAGEEALEADLRDVQISVAAELARAYFELRGAQEQLRVSTRNAENQQATADYAQHRLDAGSGTDFDTARARAQLNATLATIPAVETSIAVAQHRIAVLTGRSPDALNAILEAPGKEGSLPRLTSIGTPQDLLRRRADIRAVERRLAAATARIGVATADLFPRVSFAGEVGFAVDSIGNAGESNGEAWSFGPGIHWAAFDLGRVRARIAQTRANADGALALYEQTVLRAFEETENTLVAYGRSRRRLDYLEVSMSASRRAAELAHIRFDAGTSDFLDVLTAENSQLTAEAQYADARTHVATDLVALYKALGGDWQWQ